ncbi:MAG: FemAB family PEP-CTERM system-associated protein [Candidatus Abyssobacteria bacterium SURF_5]|uniref:FemAB family PEP-CTERM system-associated protein n=1 Tax=Abyssobacteria bacterium (strain SURF_5) TaxID=2093360 RepID=A0A3A4NNS8_ABYX5|nr:MAG: FemAB family PEP-CTERM system-associated protein [Candidatus Abyssubacteria bacterium SURF_5]
MNAQNKWKKFGAEAACRTGIFEIGRFFRRNTIPILCYHRFAQSRKYGALPAALFESHLKYIRSRFTPISFRQLDAILQGIISVNNPIILTVDDGYRDFFEVALPLLKKYGCTATFFVTTRFVDGEIWLWPDIINYAVQHTERESLFLPVTGESIRLTTMEDKAAARSRLHRTYKELSTELRKRFLEDVSTGLNISIPELPSFDYQAASWEQIREAAREGLEVGSHTMNHEILAHIDPKQAEAEVEQSKRRIETELNEDVIAFSYPNGMQGDFRQCDKEALRKNGYRFAVTCNFGFNNLDSDPHELDRIVASADIVSFTKEVSGFENLLHPGSNGRTYTASAPPATSTVVSSLCDDEQKEEWDLFVDQSESGSVFHRYAWKHVFEKSYANTCLYLIARAERAVVGVLPLISKKSLLFGNFFVSLPYFDHAGICADGQEARKSLLLCAIEFGRRANARYIEFRYAREEMLLPSKQSKASLVLQLPDDPDRLWHTLKAKVRNQIRKAGKAGLSVVSGEQDLIDDFFSVYARNMRDLGSPSHCRSFFQNICEYFPEAVRVFCVRLNHKPVAAGFTIASGDVLCIPWASSLRQYNAMCPNMLLYWAVLSYACERGFASFNFGRSTPGDGTYQFKMQWGAIPVQLYWQYWLAPGETLPNLSMTNSKYSLPVRVWKNLPLTVTEKLGPRIIQKLA